MYICSPIFSGNGDDEDTSAAAATATGVVCKMSNDIYRKSFKK